MIEDQFKPTTVNEVLLLDRIKELKALNARAGIRPDANLDHRADYRFSASELSRSEFRLPIAAEVTTREDSTGYRVEGVWVGSGKSFGFREYVDPREFKGKSTAQKSQVILRLYERALRKLANLSRDELELSA
jgi:hypothetical protein